jgi:putative membrane protein
MQTLNRSLNRGALVGLAAALSLLAAGCANQHHGMGMGAGAAHAGANLASPDMAFVATAAGNDLYEIEVSRIALARSGNAQVRNFAQMLVNHHAMSSTELATILRGKGLAPPAAMPADKQAKIAQLSQLQGAQFDREYIRISGVQDHQTAIGIFDQASRTLADADLRGFAVRTLPVLGQHLQGAQNIAGTLAG